MSISHKLVNNNVQYVYPNSIIMASNWLLLYSVSMTSIINVFTSGYKLLINVLFAGSILEGISSFRHLKATNCISLALRIKIMKMVMLMLMVCYSYLKLVQITVTILVIMMMIITCMMVTLISISTTSINSDYRWFVHLFVWFSLSLPY